MRALEEILEIDSVYPGKVLARTMEEGDGHPLSLGTIEELNENGWASPHCDGFQSWRSSMRRR
jgi:hypothetical protein